jgi:hypothetical protein
VAQKQSRAGQRLRRAGRRGPDVVDTDTRCGEPLDGKRRVVTMSVLRHPDSQPDGAGQPRARATTPQPSRYQGSRGERIESPMMGLRVAVLAVVFVGVFAAGASSEHSSGVSVCRCCGAVALAPTTARPPPPLRRRLLLGLNRGGFVASGVVDGTATPLRA